MQGRAGTVQFRQALGAFATGVTIVTTLDEGGRDIGLTVSSFNSVSLDPPMILWSLARNSRSLAAFHDACHFAVHVLAADQDVLSATFAKSGADKFADVAVERGREGLPLLRGCSARFQCRTVYRYEGGDHIIFVGEVLDFDAADRPALVFHGGRYALAARRAQPLSAKGAREQPAGSFGEDFLGYLLGRAHFQFYGRMAGILRRHGLDEQDHFILSVLGISDGRSIAEVEAVVGYTGARVDEARLASLRARGVLLDDADRLRLSPHGRTVLLELTAAAKAIEEDALSGLDESEVALLKHLLKHVIHATDPGVADPWDRSGINQNESSNKPAAPMPPATHIDTTT